MRFVITSDSDWKSRVSETLSELTEFSCRKYFLEREYGQGLSGLGVVVMCQPEELHLKQRIRYSKIDKTLYMDVMLDMDGMVRATDEQRRKIVADTLFVEVTRIITDKKIPDFDKEHFLKDFHTWLLNTGWLELRH